MDIISILVKAKYKTDSAAMLTRCACLASRQHCVEVALEGKQVYIGYRLGVLAFLLVQLQLKNPSSMSKYTSAITSLYLDMDSGYLSGVDQVNIPSCSICTKVY